MPSVSAGDEWLPLQSVIVAHSNFPSKPAAMIEHTMPSRYREEFRPNRPFSNHISEIADVELD